MFWLTYNNQAKADTILDKIAFSTREEAIDLSEWFLKKILDGKKVSISDICDAALVTISDEDRKIFDHIGFEPSFTLLGKCPIDVSRVSKHWDRRDMYMVHFPLEFCELLEEST